MSASALAPLTNAASAAAAACCSRASHCALSSQDKHTAALEAEKAAKHHPDTGPGGKGEHGLKDQTGVGGMDHGHDIKKGHHEESKDGKPKAATHSAVNPQHAEADAAHEAQVKDDIAAVKQSEQLVRDEQGQEKPHPDSHTSHKKQADDNVYNFV